MNVVGSMELLKRKMNLVQASVGEQPPVLNTLESGFLWGGGAWN